MPLRNEGCPPTLQARYRGASTAPFLVWPSISCGLKVYHQQNETLSTVSEGNTLSTIWDDGDYNNFNSLLIRNLLGNNEIDHLWICCLICSFGTVNKWFFIASNFAARTRNVLFKKHTTQKNERLLNIHFSGC